MLTYLYLRTNDLERANRFYDATLVPLGMQRCVTSGTTEAPPGLRPQYNPDFYAAYARDPNGNKLAAVCRGFTASEGRP